MNRKNVILGVIVGLAMAAAVVGLAMIVAPSIHDPVTPEQHFVQEVRAVFPEAEDTDREIIKIGLLTCSVIKADATKDLMQDVWVENGYTPREVKVVVTAAKKYLCNQ